MKKSFPKHWFSVGWSQTTKLPWLFDKSSFSVKSKFLKTPTTHLLRSQGPNLIKAAKQTTAGSSHESPIPECLNRRWVVQLPLKVPEVIGYNLNPQFREFKHFSNNSKSVRVTNKYKMRKFYYFEDPCFNPYPWVA